MTDPETGRKRERRERGSTLVTMRRRRLCRGSESSQNKPVIPRRPSARISCMSMGDSCAMSVRSSIGTRPTFLPTTCDHTRLPFTHNIQAKTGRSRPSPQPLTTSLSQWPWENLQFWSRTGPMLKCYFETVRVRVHPNSLFLFELVCWSGRNLSVRWKATKCLKIPLHIIKRSECRNMEASKFIHVSSVKRAVGHLSCTVTCVHFLLVPKFQFLTLHDRHCHPATISRT